jgi:hypothetical protein
MNVEILQVPDCPNATLLAQRLHEVLGDHPHGIVVTHRVVHDADTAAAVGMAGSPTLLVDGADPFAAPGTAASLSCRLYPGEVDGAPSIDALRAVFGR